MFSHQNTVPPPIHPSYPDFGYPHSCTASPQMSTLELFFPSHPPPIPTFAEIHLQFSAPDCFRRAIKEDGDEIHSEAEQTFAEWRAQCHSETVSVSGRSHAAVHADLG